MKINQLFRKNIPKHIVLLLLNAFNLTSLNDHSLFSKYDLEKINIVDRMNNIKCVLWEYYLPCKAVIFLVDLTTLRCITILRQILRLSNYKLLSYQKYVKNIKVSLYQIGPKEIYHKVTIDHMGVLLKF